MVKAAKLGFKDNFFIRAAANAEEVPFQSFHQYVKKEK
jgi:hypothetical protein